MKIKAFTLAELLIALAVIGILVAILLPIIFGLMPNQNVMMAKRAYYAIQTVVGNLINDEACYPNKTQASESEKRIGFDDGYGYADCTMWGGQYNTSYIYTEDANSKFLTLFVNKLDLKGDETNTSVILGSNKTYTFTTKDGIVWTAKNMHFSHSNAKPYIELMMDVNGSDGINCRYPSDPEGGPKCGKTSGTKGDFDRFTVKIQADGKISILEEWAAKAIGVNADINKAGYN